jgi:riboflavin kinase/FMN adenylyltransferase
MQQFSALQEANIDSAWLSIGAFDGVHHGHQQLLQSFKEGAKKAGESAVVLTFFPHPIEILKGALDSYYLSDPEEKAEQIARTGIDVLIVHPFDKAFSMTSAEDFLTLLKQHTGFNELWIGHDFALGHNREGDIAYLANQQDQFGFRLHVTDAIDIDDDVVSSSSIRKFLEAGEVGRAAQYLGRPYALRGEVVEGAKRGRTLGIPTANLAVWPKRVAPLNGVYACRAWLGEKSWAAVTNIGLRPTFEEQLQAPVVEAHLLDYAGEEFYGQTLRLQFLERLRGERKFDGVEALMQQIEIDIVRAREILA